MKKPTIYDIKYDTQEKAPFFFSRKTMQFFGETLKDFNVKVSPSGRIFIWAGMWDREKHFMGISFHEYVDHNIRPVVNDGDLTFPRYDVQTIIHFIQSH